MKSTLWFAAVASLLTGSCWAGSPNPRLVKDIAYLTETSYVGNLFAAGNTLYFTASEGFGGRRLWKTDGTEAGTVPLKGGFSGISEYEALGSTVFFSGYAAGEEALWKTDGTAAGTMLVRGGWGNVGASTPTYLTAFNGSVYFRAGQDAMGTLWKSNGTLAGTVVVKPDWSSHPASMIVLGNAMFFQATESATGSELWKSNGTAAGTVLLKDIASSSNSSSPGPFLQAGGSLFFLAAASGSQASGAQQLWKTDGTAPGTVNLGANPRRDAEHLMTVAGSALYFNGFSTSGSELWKSNGTAAGTVMIKDISPGPADSGPLSLTTVGTSVYFSAATPATGRELWKSDGTAAGTVMVKDLVPGEGSSNPRYFTAAGNIVYFVAADPANTTNKLWKTDGTPGGTVIVADYTVNSIYYLQPPVLMGARLFYTPTTPEHGTELWALDLQVPVIDSLTMTVAGTGSLSLLANVNPNRLSTSAWIEFGLTSSYGSFQAVTLTPDNGTTAQEARAVVVGLTPDTEYHFRLVATNSNGTACTADTMFTPITVTPVQLWRLTHFSTVDNAGPAADDADPDNDGQLNRLEYLAGTDPKQSASTLGFEVVAPPAAPGSLLLQPVRTGVRYIVQVSEDRLATWTDWPALQYDVPANGIMLTDPAALTNSSRFYRLRLEEIP